MFAGIIYIVAYGFRISSDMQWLRYLLGRPLASQEANEQRVGVLEGVAVFGLDGLGSAAYGPEAALTVLLPLGVLGLRYVMPLSCIIACLLAIVYASYMQTIGAYPNGGGAYTVAGQNLGARFGMLAGAALMLDYLLNVCVGISTGVGALVSAVPRLQPHVLGLCVAVLAVLTLMNLRGMRETGALWMLPTYAFVGCLLFVVAKGLLKTMAAGGHPQALVPPAHGPVATAVTVAVPWLFVRAFAAGCTALTGVEAVSNGVLSFKEPKERRARGTLTFIVAVLAVLLIGISFLVKAYGITATEPGKAGYQSVLSMVTAAVLGRGAFYYVTIGSILAVLSLSANTSFAGFPQLCQVMANDGYLPKSFALQGRRLTYTAGIAVLTVLSCAVLMLFGGITDRLIPLFAIGAFLAFTLSQAGMVGHWRRSEEPRAKLYIAINGIGAAATGFTTLIVFVAKFREGAWLTLAVLICIVLLLSGVRRHYDQVERFVAVNGIALDRLPQRPLMLVPVSHWNRATMAAVQFACSLSDDVRVLHITDIEGDDKETCGDWQQQLDEAASKCGLKAPRVLSIASPYRSLSVPILRYVEETEREMPERLIAVVIAEIVAAHWYQHVMHNYRAMLLKLKLFLRGNRRVVIMDMPWQLPSS